MRNQITLASKILAYENDEVLRNSLKNFCKDFNLNGVFIASSLRLLHTIEQRVNIGAVLLCDEGHPTRDLISEINTKHPEIPVFVRCDDPSVYGGFRPSNERAVVRFYKTGSLDVLGELISEHLFYRVYPEGLVERMQEIASNGIMAHFHGVKVLKERSFLASDKRIYGERFELISVRSNWCEGVMMMQSYGADVDNMVRAGRTSFAADADGVTRFSEDLLRELLNFIWGGFKAKFVSPEFSGRPTNIEVPMSINHDEKYISFGVADPLLCFKFVIENDDPSLPEMKPFELYLKFSFHLHWDPDHFHENPEVEEMAQAGELEFF